VPKDLGQKVKIKLKKTFTWTDWPKLVLRLGLFTTNKCLFWIEVLSHRSEQLHLLPIKIVQESRPFICVLISVRIVHKTNDERLAKHGENKASFFPARDDLLALE
jgi:hypothetical protein